MFFVYVSCARMFSMYVVLCFFIKHAVATDFGFLVCVLHVLTRFAAIIPLKMIPCRDVYCERARAVFPTVHAMPQLPHWRYSSTGWGACYAFIISLFFYTALKKIASSNNNKLAYNRIVRALRVNAMWLQSPHAECVMSFENALNTTE